MPVMPEAAWPIRDYVSPGLRVIRPDEHFPDLRPAEQQEHPWKYLRRDVPHKWYVHAEHPLMGVVNRDEAVLLHNIALQFAHGRALEIGGWLGWSTCHLAFAELTVDVIDPAHDDPDIRTLVESSLAACGVADRVYLGGGSSPGAVGALADGRLWDLFFIDGDHEGQAPVRDALACLRYAAEDCACVFHDLASPAVAAGLRAMEAEGFHVVVYQTAQIMGLAWRGNVTPVAHVPDPEVAWQVPQHLVGLPIMGVDFDAPPPAADRTLLDLRGGPRAAVRPSVCIVSNEIIGPHRNGGIGTATTGAAEALAAEGFAVTILYTGNLWRPDIESAARWRAPYSELGIDVVQIGFDEMRGVLGPVRDAGFAAPYLVYRYLSQRSFDVVHFNDCCGDGSLSLAAKRLGVAFHDTLLVTGLHSPSQWILGLNELLPTHLLLTAFNYAERLSVRCSDVVWSPSRYMLRWAREHGFELPEQTFVHQYSIPSARLGGGSNGLPEPQYGAAPPPREIVFFGRLEERKGLRLFCNAVQLAGDELASRGVSVTFLGKPERCAGMDAATYVLRRSAEWPFQVKLMTDLDQPEALEYLRRDGRLAVMPSPADNSPCTVYEALCWGIPFLAARTGGIPELIDRADHDRVLFDYTTESLRTALVSALDTGGRVARPAVLQADTRRGLYALHDMWRELLPPASESLEPKRYAAAIVDHRSGDALAATLEAIAACPWISRVVVLDRAGEAAGCGAQVVDLTREDADAAAREILELTEDDVVLIHSGATLLVEAFCRMLGAFDAAPVDGLLPAARVCDALGVRGFMPPLGGSPAFSLFEGVTFTGAMLVKRESLMPALQGQALATESAFLGLADFCVAGGSEIWPYPETVVELPPELDLRVRSALPARIAAYEGAPDVDRYYMLATGYGVKNGEPSVALRRQIALALVDMRLGRLVRVAARTLRVARATRSRVLRSRAAHRLSNHHRS